MVDVYSHWLEVVSVPSTSAENVSGVDKEGAQGAQAPNGRAIFFVKIEGLSTIKLGPRPPSS